MICPVCSNLMIILEYNGVETDYCPACQGTWLDSGELEIIMGNPHEKDKVFHSLKAADTPLNERSLRCPICNRKMKKVSWSDSPEIILDKCTKNHGLWFDKDELVSVINHSKKEKNKVTDQLKGMFGFTSSVTKKEE